MSSCASLKFSAIVLVSPFFIAVVSAASPYPQELHQILQRHCFDCHGNKESKGRFNLEGFKTAEELLEQHRLLKNIGQLVADKEMPPAGKPPLMENERTAILNWVKTSLQDVIEKQAGDPGSQPMRRLTQSEYERTIQAITRQPIGIAADLPTDQIGREGFCNSAQMQTLTSGHLDRYLRAAKKVAAHARITPSKGLLFEPTPVAPSDMKQIDRFISRIEAIYKLCNPPEKRQSQRAPHDLGLVLWVLWQHAQQSGDDAEFERLCKEAEVLPQHVSWVSKQLERPSDSLWVKQLLLEPWRELLSRKDEMADAAQKRCFEIADGIQKLLTISIGRHQLLLSGTMTIRSGNLLRIREAVIEKEGRKFLQMHLALTDAGIPNQGDGAVIIARFSPPFRAAFESRYPSLTKSDGKSSPVFFELPYPAFYWAEVELTGEALLDLERIDEQGKVKQGERIHSLYDLTTVTFDLAKLQTGCAVQICLELKPIRNSKGDVLTQAPLIPGQVLPSQFNASYNPHYGSGDLVIPMSKERSSKAFANTVTALDELFERFAPYLYTRTIGKVQRSDNDRFGMGLEVLYAPKEGFELWLREVYLNEQQRHDLDLAWLDLWAAGKEPELRQEGILGLHPKAAQVPLDQIKEVLAKEPLPPVETNPDQVRQTLPVIDRWNEAERIKQRIESKQWEKAFPEALAFAAKAWRRPLSSVEQEGLKACFEAARQRGLDAEEAMRTTLAAVLTSPHFLFRVETAPPGDGAEPISAHELASRLSYLLWSAPPDEKLQAAAASETILKDATLVAESRRLINDKRIEVFIQEFFGQWLQFKYFEDYVQTDPMRYPVFTPELKKHLYDQLWLQINHLLTKDRPITDLLTGTEIFISPHLARYYGLELDRIGWPKDRQGNLPRLPENDEELFSLNQKTGKREPNRPAFTHFMLADLSKTDRRGLWGMGAMLTMSSKPLRTDPIRRAHWVYTAMLGRHIPDPPPDAGQLPEDDKQGDGKSVRQRLIDHRTRSDCKACHDRFDHFGFALERYDAIGRWREQDAEGLPIDDSFTDRGELASYKGPLGLAKFFDDHSQEFIRTFCLKLIAYAMGRDPLPGDEPLIESMMKNGLQKEHRFSAYLEPLITSRQFKSRHGRNRELAKNE